MFYANEMVRLPDSPRHQNAECWLGGKSIRTANKMEIKVVKLTSHCRIFIWLSICSFVAVTTDIKHVRMTSISGLNIYP